MASMICRHCRLAICRPPRLPGKQSVHTPGLAAYSTRNSSASPVAKDDISSILSKPTWSVRSLLPPSPPPDTSRNSASSPSDQVGGISSKTLHHLLRLSALPPPASPAEEADMLNTLSSQLHFVRAIQQVDTEGVEPLRSIRDETTDGLREQTIGLRELKEALGNEDIVGHARRPRRRRAPIVDPGIEKWDVLKNASETVGPYFVVRSGTVDADQGQEKQ